MSRKVFFSFHYERDAWRAGQIRNCNVIAPEDQVGVIDAVEWESIKESGAEAIKKWIAQQLEGTSATAVLIGAETADRDWVLHEIEKSWNRGNGVFGIWIHNVKDSDKKTDLQGANPFDRFALSSSRLLSTVCKAYDWVNDNGKDNIADWAEKAIEIRANFDEECSVSRVGKRVDRAFARAGGVGAGVVGALAAEVRAPRSVAPLVRQSQPTSSPSTSFIPRAPWCSTDDDE